MKQGQLVAICGIDGSGKTVQSKALCARAENAGIRTAYFEFPQYSTGFFGELIARYLRGEMSSSPEEVDPYLSALPFACDRWEASPSLQDALAEGRLVICNRYVGANIAHQGSKLESEEARQSFRDWIEKLEYTVFGLPRPDLQIWLDIPPEIALQLIAGKSDRDYLKDKKDIHEKNRRHLEATYNVYRQLATSSESWATVKCTREDGGIMPEEDIADKIWDIVSAMLTH
jgi:dTMP kinase